MECNQTGQKRRIEKPSDGGRKGSQKSDSSPLSWEALQSGRIPGGKVQLKKREVTV